MRIKLALIITGLSTGGAEIMLLKVLQHIDRTCFDPFVISLTTKGEIGPEIEVLDIPLVALNMRPCRLNLAKFLQLIQILKKLNPVVVHTWMYHADLLGGLAARLAGIRTVGHAIRNSNLSPSHSKLSTRCTMKACALLSHYIPKKILSCSETAKNIHIAAGYDKGKFCVIPNGFDVARFCPNPNAYTKMRSQLELPQDTPIVGLIARFDPQKNHRGFFQAIRRVHKILPNTHFLLAGTDIERKNRALQAIIPKDIATNHIHLLGKRKDMPDVMAALDLLVSSSSFGEAFPNIIGEAMACGVPCVATAVGDCAEIIGESELVVPAGDMQGLAQNIIKILRLPKQKYREVGMRARTRILEKYDIKTIIKRYETFYEELAS